MNKNPLIAFFLSFLPGWGHFYLNKKARFVLYGIGFWFPLLLGGMSAILIYEKWLFVMFTLLALFVWCINVFDMVVTLLIQRSSPTVETIEGMNGAPESERMDRTTKQDYERFFTILLSFIPGLGHFHLGLMYRGLTLMIAFFGLATMVVFVAFLANSSGFLVFLGVWPIIWIYSFFDAIQQLNRKQRGETLNDRTIFEEFEETREKGKKSKTIATLLAVFPGAGHMYLGLQRRGLQLMATFLFSIYILDVLQLSLFLFVIPIIWFYSFFDALQQASKYGRVELIDRPLVGAFVNHQRWIGIGLIAVGAYYLLDRVLMFVFDEYFSSLLGIDLQFWYHQYFQTTVVSIVLIGGGLKLLFGSKKRQEDTDE